MTRGLFVPGFVTNPERRSILHPPWFVLHERLADHVMPSNPIHGSGCGPSSREISFDQDPSARQVQRTISIALFYSLKPLERWLIPCRAESQ